MNENLRIILQVGERLPRVLGFGVAFPLDAVPPSALRFLPASHLQVVVMNKSLAHPEVAFPPTNKTPEMRFCVTKYHMSE